MHGLIKTFLLIKKEIARATAKLLNYHINQTTI